MLNTRHGGLRVRLRSDALFWVGRSQVKPFLIFCLLVCLRSSDFYFRHENYPRQMLTIWCMYVWYKYVFSSGGWLTAVTTLGPPTLSANCHEHKHKHKQCLPTPINKSCPEKCNWFYPIRCEEGSGQIVVKINNKISNSVNKVSDSLVVINIFSL